VFQPETTTFLESGCALIVAAVTPDGEPRAARAWGLTVTSADGECRLLLPADDVVTHDLLRTNGRIAVTGASVRTLRSIQCKGTALAVEPATDLDRERAAAYSDQFLTDVEETDGVPRVLLERMVPDDYVACTLRVEELYDQTPGPGAGAKISTGAE
jgi:hypothetical protein